MKHNRQDGTVTTVLYDAPTVPTPLLDLLVDKHESPLLHAAVEELERQSTELEFVEEVLYKPKPKYHYEYECSCYRGGQHRSCAKSRYRVYDA